MYKEGHTKPITALGRVAPFAVIERECGLQVADSAKLRIEDSRHRKMLGGLLLDVEDLRMTV